jgi:TPR repeat protein
LEFGRHGAGSTDAAEKIRGVALLEITCGAHAEGCAELGQALLDSDPVRSLSAFAKACEAGDVGGCVGEGAALWAGRGAPKDPAKAIPLLARGCESKFPEACLLVGAAYGTGVENGSLKLERDPAKSADAYEKACTGGVAEGCDELALAYADGKGRAKDVPHSVELLEKGCDGGMAKACNLGGTLILGNASLFGDTITADTRAIALFKKGCDGGHGASCMNLGGATYVGVGGLQADKAKAKKLFEIACEKGISEGCERAQRP